MTKVTGEAEESGITLEEVDLSPEESQNTLETEVVTETLETDGQVSEPPLETTGQEGEGYTDPLLKGKTPEQIQKMFLLQQETIATQNRDLNAKYAQESAPAPTELPSEEGVYGDDFLAEKFAKVEGRVVTKLEQMIAPLIQANIRSAGGSVREGLRRKHEHFSLLEPHMDKVLRDGGFNPAEATEADLENLYFNALGRANAQGIDLNAASNNASAPAPVTPKKEERPMSIPQHRPSSAPLPSSTVTKVRPLNEEEKRLAREQFSGYEDPEAAFREYMDMEIDDVVAPGFSKEGFE